MKYAVKQAVQSQLDEIYAIYQQVKGQQGCTWNEHYPAYENIEEDIKYQNLYCLYPEDGKAILSAAAFYPGSRLTEIFGNEGTPFEIFRVVTPVAFQGKGYAKILMTLCFDLLKSRGFDRAHLSVACRNDKALALYKNLGFKTYPRIYQYGEWFYPCQLLLRSESSK